MDNPLIVDLFAGPGGLDVAAHWLDIPAIGIEFDEAAVDTREAAGLSTIHSDVRGWQPSDFTSAVNVLTGGPPCQTFTVAGNGHGRRALDEVIGLVERLGEGRIDEVVDEVAAHEDARTGLVLQPLIWALRAIEAGRPFQAILLEQVPAVRPVWEAMKTVLKANGYGADVDVLRTEEYGVPQTRRRAVLAARHDVPDWKVELPKGTHQPYVGTAVGSDLILDLGSCKPKWISMSEALGWAEPFTVVSNYGTGGDPKNRCKRRHDRPAFTVTGKVSRNRVVLDGKRGERRFGPAEAGRLQTFPTDYPWSGRDVPQQIGNAIPPRLGAHVLAWLLGIDVRLDEEFFAARNSGWTGPTAATAERVRGAIENQALRWDSLTKVAGGPMRVERSDDDRTRVVGVVGSRSAIDAVEQAAGHEARTPAAVGAAP
ncbi:DNA cytosine methyltransferase [Gordonia zhaorongruii]|uniref:DNA cytosine methyltransferase n=1 Tax=Gordonia zhaorongruii TaxID=2597659 RepID=UPI001F174766|nr:DNA cytosine methyltransferase [Gordonia zhaorongruii]